MLESKILLLLFISLSTLNCARSRQISVDKRHSYSLTTFDANGKLAQVERAAEAVSHGVPIVAVAKENWVLMLAPQVLPSPLYVDDGTSRFSQVSPQILVSHSGISADGRILVTAAKRLAIDHEFTFEEDIGISTFLREMGLFFQEYTMKPGARPFGSCLFVAYLPSSKGGGDSSDGPQIYRIDPSGNIQAMGNVAVLSWKDDDLRTSAQQAIAGDGSLEDATERLSTLFHETLEKAETTRRKQMDDSELIDRRPVSILTASMDSNGKFTKRKRS